MPDIPDLFFYSEVFSLSMLKPSAYNLIVAASRGGLLADEHQLYRHRAHHGGINRPRTRLLAVLFLKKPIAK